MSVRVLSSKPHEGTGGGLQDHFWEGVLFKPDLHRGNHDWNAKRLEGAPFPHSVESFVWGIFRAVFFFFFLFFSMNKLEVGKVKAM